MLIKETKYCYNDIAIVPAIKSSIEHRSECNPYLGAYGDSMLPIFAAPMSTVVNEKNFDIFENNKIIPIIPRNIPLETRMKYLQNNKWTAVSLQEFEDLFISNKWNFIFNPYVSVLIDVANGHMTKLHNLIRTAKDIYKEDAYKLRIMCGNVANPETYRELAKAGVDFIRLSVGTGSGCFVKGTKILMADGTQSNIEDVDKGDYVLTKNGAYKVLNTFVKNKKETVKINNEIESTLDHKFFVIRKTDVTENMTDEDIKEKGFYIEAQYLCEDYLLVKV